MATSTLFGNKKTGNPRGLPVCVVIQMFIRKGLKEVERIIQSNIDVKFRCQFLKPDTSGVASHKNPRMTRASKIMAPTILNKSISA